MHYFIKAYSKKIIILLFLFLNYGCIERNAVIEYKYLFKKVILKEWRINQKIDTFRCFYEVFDKYGKSEPDKVYQWESGYQKVIKKIDTKNISTSIDELQMFFDNDRNKIEFSIFVIDNPLYEKAFYIEKITITECGVQRDIFNRAWILACSECSIAKIYKNILDDEIITGSINATSPAFRFHFQNINRPLCDDPNNYISPINIDNYKIMRSIIFFGVNPCAIYEFIVSY